MFVIAKLDDNGENTNLCWAYTTLEDAIKRIMFENLDGELSGRSNGDYTCDICDKHPQESYSRYKCLRCDDWDICGPCFTENKMAHKHDGDGGCLGVYDEAMTVDDDSLAALIQTGMKRDNAGAWWVNKVSMNKSPFTGIPWYIRAEQESAPYRSNDFAGHFKRDYKLTDEWIPKTEWFAELSPNGAIIDLVNVNFDHSNKKPRLS